MSKDMKEEPAPLVAAGFFRQVYGGTEHVLESLDFVLPNM